MSSVSDIISVGLIYVGQTIKVEVSFDVNQDVAEAYVDFTVPAGVTYHSQSMDRGTYNSDRNRWEIGPVFANEDVLEGEVTFSITDASLSEFTFVLEGGVEDACPGCVTGNTKTIRYTGITCDELLQCKPSVVIGQIVMFGGTTAPEGWTFCDGSELAIATYPELFAVVGTAYGGDGITTFAVPDMRGRVAVGSGSGVGLTTRALGDTGGEEDSTLTTNEMPAHDHTVTSTVNVGTAVNDPTATDNYLPITTGSNFYSDTKGATDFASDMVENTVSTEGSGVSFTNMQPFNTVNYIIATQS